MDRPRFFGWRVLAIAIVTSVLTGPGQTIGVSVFIDHLVADLGLSRSGVSTAYLFGTLTGALAMPAVGRFIDRRGVRVAQVSTGTAFAVAVLAMAAVPTAGRLLSEVSGLSPLLANVILLSVGFSGIRMWGQGALSMVTNVAVTLWFDKRRGLAMGILATVASAGMALVPIALNALIGASTWRWAWVVAAAVVFVVVVPLGWFGLVDRPATVGQVPDGHVPDERVPESPVPATGVDAELQGLDRWEAARRLEFWMLVAVAVAVSMLITGLNFHQIDLLGEVGLDAGQAAAMFLPQIIGSSLAGIGFGWAMDRVGIRFVPAVVGAILLVTHLLVANLSGGLSVVLYAVLLGACIGATRSVLSTASPAYFGTAHIGAIGGLMAVAMVASSALGPVTLSVMEAWLGGYRQANLALAVFPAAVTLLALANPSRLFEAEEQLVQPPA
jgi:MFS family permease